MSYDTVVTGQGATRYWRCEETSGTTLVDDIAAGNGTLVGSPTLQVAGPFAGSHGIQFDGSTQYATATRDLSATDKLSVSFWLYWDAFANNDKTALEFGTGYGGNNSFTADPNSSGPNGTWTIGFFKTGFGYFLDGFTRPSATAWHHYVLTSDRGAEVSTAYVDGGSSQSMTPSHGPGTPYGNWSSSTWYFMTHLGSAQFGAGRLSRVAEFAGLILVGADASAQYNAASGSATDGDPMGTTGFFGQ